MWRSILSHVKIIWTETRVDSVESTFSLAQGLCIISEVFLYISPAIHICPVYPLVWCCFWKHFKLWNTALQPENCIFLLISWPERNAVRRCLKIEEDQVHFVSRLTAFSAVHMWWKCTVANLQLQLKMQVAHFSKSCYSRSSEGVVLKFLTATKT